MLFNCNGRPLNPRLLAIFSFLVPSEGTIEGGICRDTLHQYYDEAGYRQHGSVLLHKDRRDLYCHRLLLLMVDHALQIVLLIF